MRITDSLLDKKSLWIVPGLLPLVLFGITMVLLFTNQQEKAIDQLLHEASYNAMHLVDRAIGEQVGLLKGLAVSQTLDSGDFESFRTESQRLKDQHREWRTVILTDERHMVFNLLISPHQPLLPLRDPTSLKTVWETKSHFVGNLSNNHVAIRVPVIREGQMLYTLVVPINPQYFTEVLQKVRTHENWGFIIVGSDGLVIAASPETGLKTGDTTANRGQETILPNPGKTQTLFSLPVDIPASGWRLHISTPAAFLKAPFVETRLLVLFFGIIAAALSIVLILMVSSAWADRRETHHLRQEIAERQRIEEERQRLEGQLQQALKMEAIGTLAGGIAHDFNNILGAIIGFSEIALEDCPPDSAVSKDLTQILKAGHRAKELVKQILVFSRQSKTDLMPLDPAILINENVKLLRSSLPTIITIQKDIDRDIGFILADPTQIHQIVMNLCTNAFHAMETGGGTLTISLKEKIVPPGDLDGEPPPLKPGKYLHLAIRDTGTGIAPEIRERIFDPYFTTKEIGKGTGMGLSIVHGIVKNLGGSITCDSQPGVGTVFDILLPTEEGRVPEDTKAKGQAPRGKERILLVDDERILVETTKIMLERLGYQVTAGTNGVEALALFQENPQRFDLVISDQTMPGMTGIEMAKHMLEIRPTLPIILCTGYSSLLTKEKAMAQGVKGFADKPLSKNDIAALIRQVLDNNPL